MAANFEVGTIAAKTSTGTQAYSLTGSFTPKLLILWGIRRTTDGNELDFARSFGAAISSTSRFAGYDAVIDDNSLNGYGGMIQDKVYHLVDDGGTVLSSADLDSFGAGSFTLDFTTAGSAYSIGYLAIGGADVNAYIGNFAGQGTTGSQAITGVGFQPTAVLFHSSDLSTTQWGTVANGTVSGFFGCATASTEEWAMAWDHRSINSTTNDSRQTASNCLLEGDTATGLADFTSMDSDGFTVNWTTADDSYYYFVAINGVDAFAGNNTQKTSTGTQAYTGVGFQPDVLLMMGTDDAVLDTSRTDIWGHSIGATDATSEFAIWYGENRSTGSDMSQAADETIQSYNAGTPTLNAEANISSFDSDGYTLNWGAADATARYHFILALADAGGGATFPGWVTSVGSRW